MPKKGRNYVWSFSRGIVLLKLIVLNLLLSFLAAPVLAEGQESQDTFPEGVGPYKVGYVEFSNMSKRAGKRLRVGIHYPATESDPQSDPDSTGAPYPTMLFSTGIDSLARHYYEFSKTMASYGFVFVVVESHLSAKDLERSEDLVQILNWLEVQNDNSSFKLNQMIDKSRIGVTGHSMGGAAAILAPANESRFKISVPIAASVDERYTEATFESAADVKVPIFIVAGDKDYGYGRASPEIYKEANPPKFLLIVISGTHGSLVLDYSEDRVEKYIIPFLKVYLCSEEEYISYLCGEHAQQEVDEGKIELSYDISESVAFFVLSRLIIEPSSVEEGGQVTISADVINNGTLSGSHTVTLKIDEIVKDEKTVTLNPDETVTISFELSATQQGIYFVDVNGLTGSYRVTEKEEPSGGIPGFPYEAIILGVVAGIVILWMIQRRR